MAVDTPNGVVMENEDGTFRPATNKEANDWAELFAGGDGNLSDKEISKLYAKYGEGNI